MIAYNRIDLTNKRFGKLKVLQFSHSNKNGAYWKCLCTCGNLKNILGTNLRKKLIKSCGCLRIEYARLGKGQSGFNRLLRSYKRDAKRRNLKFNLTIKKFKEITSKNCHYCTRPPLSETVALSRGSMVEQAKEHSKYFYNGIDRVDNKKGYTVSNSVPCCVICNRAKSSLTYKEFMEYINRIRGIK